MNKAIGNAIYFYGLGRVTEKCMIFVGCYFPFRSKTIELSLIDHVEVLMPSLMTGKWRIHGSGDLRTWFPRDRERPKRDHMFLLHLTKRWGRIGFTVEDSNALIDAFKEQSTPIVGR